VHGVLDSYAAWLRSHPQLKIVDAVVVAKTVAMMDRLIGVEGSTE
jgi:hypothetical protein